MENNEVSIPQCKVKIMAISDAMYIMGGKWKMHIIASLCYGARRYSELLENIDNISGKMLSRELKEMETNLLIERKVMDTRPFTVQYELTEYGKKLLPVIDSLADWGIEHRKIIMKGSLEKEHQY
ncbi:HxlR family transcriptional regulator [Anditalea andensis]|uniref:HxlR family transcriptional regulator n=2 Tax=Anditalea andensis TaxID=1048983 RepID=A0A074L338_9BACT|nr:HxlR family transcriptional regulator [Anditalea andensis]